MHRNTSDIMVSETVIAYVRENCRFYAADIYSWLRVVLDFALDEDELACNEDNGVSIEVDGRSVTVRSEPWYNKGVGQKHLGLFLEPARGGMYYDVQKDLHPIQTRAMLLSVFSEELIVSITYCHQKQTVVASRGKVLSDTTEDTSEFSEVYLKATFDPEIYGDITFDPLSVDRILNWINR